MIEHLQQDYFSPLRLAFWEDDELGPYGLPPIEPATLPLMHRKKRDIDALKKISSWEVVMRVIVVHTDSKTAGMTGLFGLLADAPIFSW